MKNNILFIILLFVCVLTIESQTYNSLYHSKFIPERHLVNPSYQPLPGFYLGVDAALTTYLPFALQDIADIESIGDTTNMVLSNSKLNELKGSKLLRAELLGAFSFGFRVNNKTYITFNLSPKVFSHAGLPIEGISDYLSTAKMDLSELNMLGMGYNEFAFGFSQRSDNNVTLGVKLKYLSGLGIFQTQNNGLKISTSSGDGYLESDIEVQTQLPVSIVENNEGHPNFDSLEIAEFSSFNDYKEVFLNSGSGFGLDIGISVKPSKKFSFSASVIDFGYINWKSTPYSLNIKGDYNTRGVPLDSLIGNDNDYTFNAQDTLNAYFDFQSSRAAFTTFTPVQIFIGAEYDITPTVGVGIVSNTRFVQSKPYQQFTLSLNTRLGRTLSFSPTVSMYNYSDPACGFLLAMRPVLPFLHIYFGVDNIPLPFKYYVDSSKKFYNFDEVSILPSNMYGIAIRFGLNFVIGYNSYERKLKDKPLIF
ncbi:DUF5723 family protein [Bacteroidales bacterium]|nr:DUF5723 family protein [Bacteroidales bacterium]